MACFALLLAGMRRLGRLVPMIVVATFIAATSHARQASFEFGESGAGARSDAEIAVSPTQVIGVTNWAYKVFDKTGTLLVDQTLATFKGVGGGDPVILWDPHVERFVFCSLSNSGSGLVIGISNSADVTDPDPWTFWYMPASDVCENGEFDYPNLGVNEEAIFISVRVDCPSIGYYVLVIDKDLLATGLDPLVQVVVSPIGYCNAVATYGNTGVQYFAGTDSPDTITLFAITSPLTVPATVSICQTSCLVTTPTDFYPPLTVAPQLGDTDTIQSAPTNIKHGVYQTSSDSLWICHTAALDWGLFTRYPGKIHWAQIEMNGWPNSMTYPTVAQSGYVDEDYSYFGDIVADEDGNMGLVFNTSSSTEYVSVAWAHRRGDDPADTLRATHLEYTASGAQTVGGSSVDWGDYSGIALDPGCPGLVWFHGQYEGGVPYNTWIGSFFIYAIADINGDGLIDFSDYTSYLNLYGELDPEADLNDDEVVDYVDYLLFLGGYTEPCEA